MMRRVLALGAAVVAAGSLAACGGGGGSEVGVSTGAPTRGAASTVPSNSATASEPAFLQHLAVGECLNDTGEEWTVRDCDKGHEYEVSAVVPSKWDKRDIGARGVLRTWTCDDVAAAYLGGPILATFFTATPLPAADDPGSSERIICLTHQYKDEDGAVVQTVGRMRGRLVDPENLRRRRTCLESPTTAPGAVQILPCTARHSAEAVTTVSLGDATAPYPDAATLRTMMRKLCAPKVKAFLGGVERPDLTVGVTGFGEQGWRAGHRFAICFVNIKGPKTSQSVQNIRHQPLKDYR